MVGLYEICVAILDLAKTLCPKDTGSLANSGKIKRIGSGIYRVQFGDGIRRNTEDTSLIDYALIVELDDTVYHSNGTSHFLTKAGDFVDGYIKANNVPVGIKFMAPFVDNGSPNCIALNVYDRNIIRDDMVSGYPLGMQLENINIKEQGDRRSLVVRIRESLNGIVSCLRNILEDIRK